MKADTEIRTKATCCNSDPVCKRCPVLWRRMQRHGKAVKLSKRRFRTVVRIPKAELRRARQR